MPVWRIEDDCIAKSAKLTLNYKGLNPLSIYQKVRGIIKQVTRVKEERIWERDYRYDTIGDLRGFYIRLYVYFKRDARTFILFELIFQGKQPVDPNKSGNLTMSISARLITEYRLDSTFQQSILYRSLLRMYYYLFYSEVRRRNLEDCNKYIDEILEKIRSELNLETK